MKMNIMKVAFFFLTLVLMYFTYKATLLINYKVDVEKKGIHLIEELEKSGDTIEVKQNTNLDNEKIITYKNISYKKLDDNFELDKGKSSMNVSDNYNTYYLKNESSTTNNAIFKVGKADYNLYEIFSSDEIFVYGFNLKNVNRKKLLNKYKLNNDYDIIKYIINHYKDQVNIFSSGNQIKMNYFMKTFAYTAIPASKLYLIDGDYKGYIYAIDNDRYYEVHIFNNNENHVFSFINMENEKYFTLDSVKEFISNIRFVES